MNQSTIKGVLMQRFPELTPLYKEQFNLWGSEDIPLHCFFGDVLNNYVTELLRENKNKHQIEKMFDFYEEMANSDDDYVRNLLQVTLLEYLWDMELVFKNALKYMKPKTREINNKISIYLNAPFMDNPIPHIAYNKEMI